MVLTDAAPAGDDIDEYVEEAAGKIGEMYRDLRRLNDEVAREGAMTRCKEAYEEVEEGVGAGTYASIKVRARRLRFVGVLRLACRAKRRFRLPAGVKRGTL